MTVLQRLAKRFWMRPPLMLFLWCGVRIAHIGENKISKLAALLAILNMVDFVLTQDLRGMRAISAPTENERTVRAYEVRHLLERKTNLVRKRLALCLYAVTECRDALYCRQKGQLHQTSCEEGR